MNRDQTLTSFCGKENLEREKRSARISRLSDDLLLKIISAANPTPRELCQWSCVSKNWKSLCYLPLFWSKLDIKHGEVRKGFERLASRCSSLTHFHMEDPRCELQSLRPIFQACAQSLRRISLQCDPGTNRQQTPEPSVSSILWLSSLHCKNVESIALLSSSTEISLGPLESKIMWYLTSGFRSLSSFTNYCRDSMTRQSIYLLVIGWQQLRHLHIHVGSLELQDLVLLNKCSTLSVLEFTGTKLGLMKGHRHGMVLHSEVRLVCLSQTSMSPAEITLFASLFPSLVKMCLKEWLFLQTLQKEEQKNLLQFLAESFQRLEIHSHTCLQ
eukprot:TRINITY_DN1592_c0_g1_i1.p1 TRINITY_DN1592_c0_g1~~TRINITY_DN1592_c0_g1_i1.p1  ORF type:complete len:328 (-),score=47.49 TRINITY_DN1592_c0_g1_i1:124-1107(-)